MIRIETSYTTLKLISKNVAFLQIDVSDAAIEQWRARAKIDAEVLVDFTCSCGLQQIHIASVCLLSISGKRIGVSTLRNCAFTIDEEPVDSGKPRMLLDAIDAHEEEGSEAQLRFWKLADRLFEQG